MHAVASADGHLIEPADLWTTRMPESMRSIAPRYVYWDDYVTLWKGETEGPSIRVQRGFDGEVIDHRVEQRLRDLDADGIWAEVMFPQLGMQVFQTVDPDLAIALARVYNDFVAEAYAPHRDRLIPMAAVPVLRIDDAIAEVERAAALGLRGILVAIRPPRPYSLPEYDPLWAAAQAHGMPVTFHAGAAVQDFDWGSFKFQLEGGPEADALRTWSWYATSSLPAQEVVTQFVGGGVLARFPDLHVISVENNAFWLAGLMAAMDKAWTLGVGQPERHEFGMYDHARAPDDQPNMLNLFHWGTHWPHELRPSDYVRRQVHATFMDDPAAIAFRGYTGVDALLWAADYPHAEGTFPKSRDAIDLLFDEVSDAERAAMTGGTLAKLFGLELPATV